MSYFEQVIVGGIADSPILDAFGRFRVSAPLTLFDGKTLTDTAPIKFSDAEVSGGWDE